MDEPNEQDDDKSPKGHISWEELKRKKLSPEDIARIKEQALQDVDKWESGELGAAPQYARKSVPGRREDIDEKLGIQELVLRLKTETVDELTRQAEDEGIILGALLRRILEAHVDRR
jgi:hypothetical protein